MPILRPGTLDHAIWSSIANEYSGVPARFEPGDVVLDVGCHIGAFSVLAAHRGARVVGYEASAENAELAWRNTAHLPGVEIRRAAVWRSDEEAPPDLTLTPPLDPRNTGGASVLYRGEAAPAAGGGPPAIPVVPLDDVLRELGAVRLLKIDAEGSEYPILATARELARVATLVGELHRLSAADRARLAPAARRGVSFVPDDLLRGLLARGFTVAHGAWDGDLLRFVATR